MTRQTPPAPPRHRTLQLLWAAILTSVGAYWLIGAAVVSQPRESGSPIDAVAVVLIALSGSTYLAVWGLQRRQLALIGQHLTPTNLPRLMPETRAALAGQLRITVVICLALLETPPIYALAALLVRLITMELFAAFIGMSAALLIAFYLTVFGPVFRTLDTLQPPGAPPS